MKISMFAIYDDKAEAFIQPFFSPNQAVAKRQFSTAINTVDHAFNANAADYTLFELGEFDQSTGSFSLLGSNVNLGNGLIFRRSVMQEERPEIREAKPN